MEFGNVESQYFLMRANFDLCSDLCVTMPLALVLPSAIVYLIACDLIVGSILRAAAKRESITFVEQPEKSLQRS